MKSSNRQSIIMIGIGVLVIAIILLVYSLNLPKVAPLDETSAAVSVDYSSNATDSTVSVSNTLDVSSSETTVATSVESYAMTSYSVKENKEETTVGAKVDFPINLNTCTANDLLAINGIGETRANAIIEYRNYLGSYTSVEQLKNIKGIGDSVFAKIEPYVTV